MTSEESLQAVQATIGYRFNRTDLLIAALTHSSSADARVNSNERLEFVGDAILGMVICHALYQRFPHYLEGELTKIKSAVVSRRTCASISRRLGLHKHLIVGKGMTSRSQMPNSLAAAVYESLIAAIYLDSGGLGEAERFILETASEDMTLAAESEHQSNFKSQLQQHAQRALSATPCYDLMDEKGPDHSKCFEISVIIQGRRYASAWGPSKKEAEQKAAYLALRALDAVDLIEELEPDHEADAV